MNIEQGLRIENENLKRLLEETERERDEALAQSERLRGALNMQMAISGGVESGDSVYDRSMDALNEQPPAALAALKAEWQADVTYGDPLNLLPAIGSTVYFHLASSDSWEPYVVTGFSAWASLADGDGAYHRVFVRGRSKSGHYNSRLLKDIRLPIPVSSQPCTYPDCRCPLELPHKDSPCAIGRKKEAGDGS